MSILHTVTNTGAGCRLVLHRIDPSIAFPDLDVGVIAGERPGASDRRDIIGGFENERWSCNAAAFVQNVCAVSSHLASASGMNANGRHVFGGADHLVSPLVSVATRLR